MGQSKLLRRKSTLDILLVLIIAIRDMKVRTNTIITQWKSKVELFNSQCLPLYGCHLWKLDDRSVDKLCATWKVCYRRLLRLDPRTRSHLIPHLMENAHIHDIIMYSVVYYLKAIFTVCQ